MYARMYNYMNRQIKIKKKKYSANIFENDDDAALLKQKKKKVIRFNKTFKFV